MIGLTLYIEDYRSQVFLWARADTSFLGKGSIPLGYLCSWNENACNLLFSPKSNSVSWKGESGMESFLSKYHGRDVKGIRLLTR